MTTLTSMLVGTVVSAAVAVTGVPRAQETYDRWRDRAAAEALVDETKTLGDAITTDFDVDVATMTLTCVPSADSPCASFSDYDSRPSGAHAFALLHRGASGIVLIGMTADGKQWVAYDSDRGGITGLSHTALAGLAEGNGVAESDADQAAIEAAAKTFADQVTAWVSTH